MAKHRRWSDKPKPEPTQTEEKPVLSEPEPPNPKNSTDFKSRLLSGTKYIYIIAIAGLLSGIFTPLTIDVEFESVIFGMLTLFLGLGGGIMIFLGIKWQKFTIPMLGGGLAIIFTSLIIIYELAGHPLF
tara:strand:- start:2673 stop:3059 length:387 start_codon:yes stop_codon:yes gene_type:complete